MAMQNGTTTLENSLLSPIKLERHHMTQASLVTQTVKRLPAMRETRVRSLDREDPLEKEMATHYGILAWRIPWMEVHGVAKSQTQLCDFTLCLIPICSKLILNSGQRSFYSTCYLVLELFSFSHSTRI